MCKTTTYQAGSGESIRKEYSTEKEEDRVLGFSAPDQSQLDPTHHRQPTALGGGCS
jgi:hypothetical protein